MKTALTLYIGMLVVAILGALGCIFNLIAVVSGFLHSVPLTTLFIGRIIGLFVPPLGALLGWFA